VDRVQPNHLRKTLLDGEWYSQSTVIGMPASNGFTFVGYTSFKGVKRVRWDIQEKFLYARRTTELIEGASTPSEEEAQGGEVVAAFRVESHFDIMRPYNEATGEEMNIVEENTRDRPWFERSYIRVDWSENLVTNADLRFETVSVESVPNYVQEIDPKTGKPHRHAPVFEADGSYFDVTTRVYAKAGTYDIPGWGKIPLCWFSGASQLRECGSGEYTLRHSFKRVDPVPSYQPREYDAQETKMFGYFTAERLRYDSQHGIRHQEKQRYLQRHSIWETMFAADGSVLPPEERVPRPIVYYLNEEFPREDQVLLETARDVANKWSDVFEELIEELGHPRQRMFVLCENNPVKKGDPEVCGPPGRRARLGDLRYSMMAYIPDYMTYGLLGYGPSNHDPETGEILSSSAYVYHHNNTAAFDVAEMVSLLNETLGPEEYIDGVDLGEWVERVNGDNQWPASSFSLSDAERMVRRFGESPMATRWEGRQTRITEADVAQQLQEGFHSWLEPRLEEHYQSNEQRHRGGRRGQARLQSLAGTEIEALLTPDELLLGAGQTMGAGGQMGPVSEEVLKRASVLRGGVGGWSLAEKYFEESFAQQQNIYTRNMADDALLGLAREFRRQGMSPEEVYNEVRRMIYTGVWTHELGHTLGLMHNFGGSDDAVNYFDAYWNIRSADGTVRPRVVDPMTDFEVDKKIYNYAYSSVMDYTGRLTMDHFGPGKYDRAAVFYGYGDKIEVFKDTPGIESNWFRDWVRYSGDVQVWYSDRPNAIHYTTFYNNMGPLLHLESNREWVDLAEIGEDFVSDDVGRLRVPYIYCSHSRVNLGERCLTRDIGADPGERMQNLIDTINTWYIARSFPRGKVTSTWWGYVNRNYWRLYDRLKRWNNYYGLMLEVFPRYFEKEALEDFYLDPVNGWGSYTWSIHAAFNQLVQTILMPDVASYGPTVDWEGDPLQSRQFSGDSFDLGVSQGRYYSTSWRGGNRDCGYFWWDCLHHFGFYLDKMMAIYAISDSRTNFAGRATPEDIRGWEVGYFNTFPEQILALNTSIMGQNWSFAAPYWEDRTLKFPDYAGDLNVDHGNTAVDPMATFTIQLYWQVLGKAFFNDTFDQRFNEESRISVAGTGASPDLPADQRVTFDDPITGLTYVARRSVDGDPAAGEVMLERCNRLYARSSFCGRSPDDVCEEPAAPYTREAVSAELMDYSQLVEVLVQVDGQMGWGDPMSP
jgi:hypothetical protein